MKIDYDCAIIGAGVSGMTAAIYLKRAELNVCLLEKSAPGGQINKTSIIENYPGFTGEGPELALKIFEQVMNLNVPYMYADIIDIKKIENGFAIIGTDKTVTAKKVLLATGRSPRRLELPLEEKLTGKGISWCAICDGPLYKNKVVAVVGSGNSALEESLYLSSICKKVIVLNRSKQFKGSKILQNKLLKKSNVELFYETFITGFEEKDNKLDQIILYKKGNEEKLNIDGLFIYIGFVPDTDYLRNIGVELNDQYVLVDDNMQTNIPGIYACGDILKKEYYQISNAVGEAAEAALTISHELELENE